MIDRDDWLQAIQAADATPPVDDDSLTASELAEFMGCSLPTAYVMGRRLIEQGRAVEVSRKIGRRRVTAYKLTK